MRKRTAVGLLALCAGLLGCASKFTRAHYDMIKEGVDDRFHVRQVIGDPNETIADREWYYQHDDGYAARIHFDENGRVIGKEWMDARTGEWSGHNPHGNPPPGGEVREQRTRTRQVDVHGR